MKAILTTVTILFSICSLIAQSYTSIIDELDAYIEQSKQQWEVPGLAVAIVKDGKPLLVKGYGEKQIGLGQPVDSETLFVNASTTKAMTAVAMGILVDQELVDWDDPVINYLPQFQLADPYVTQSLRIRDLFTHNAGLGNADFLWVNNDLSQEEILFQLRYLEGSYPFRGGYTYQNIMYLAAGKVIEAISGLSWEAFMLKNIFAPLGMNRSFPSLSAAKQQDNLSIPHDYVGQTITPIQDTDADAIGPAGSVWSCAKDMAIWMSCLLDSTKFETGRLLKAQTFQEIFSPQIVIPIDRFYASKKLTKPHWTTYALGWFQHDYRGRFVCFHTGSLAGRVAILGMIPDEKIGVFVYGNLSGAEVRHAIMYKVFDLFGKEDPNIDWSTALKQIYDDMDQTSADRRSKQMAKKLSNTTPSHSLNAYAGIYSDPYFGRVSVEVLDNQLKLIPSSKVELSLSHWHYDTFLGTFNKAWYTPSFIQFFMNAQGEINRLEYAGKSFKKVKTN